MTSIVMERGRTGARRMRERGFALLVSAALVASMLIVSGPSGALAASATDFFVTPHDLEFILKSIQISEAHAEAESTGDQGYSLVCDDPADTTNTCVPHPRLPWGLRTVTGEHNNLFPNRAHFGAGGNVFPRLVPAHFTDADPVPEGPHWPIAVGQPTQPTSYTQTNGYVYDAHPRLISNLIVDQTVNNPAAIAAANNTQDYGSAIDLGEPSPSWGVWEEDDDALTYSSSTTVIDLSEDGGGTARAFDGVGSYVEFVVNDGFRWFGNRGTHRGIAEITVNGVVVGEVDQYAPAREIGQLFAIDDLGAGPNVVRITNVGQHAEAQATRTVVDSIHHLTMNLDGGTGNVFIPDVAPDEGLSAPFTGWLTLFGQFFDHGLDLVEKGGNGTVVVPLRTDDPLYVEGAPNFLTLTRATRHGDGTQHLNRTTPFVDQNQTYTSHPSHQVFLREYDVVDGVPTPTGHLLDGADGGLATWAEVKEQAATKLGIQLNDMDVHDVPLVATDPYGRFIGGPNGLPQLVIEDGETPELVEADLATPIATGELVGLLGAGHAFLDDIAHGAAPGQVATSGPTAGQVVPHDAALLASHYIAGDGRANENIALTAVHHVFHSEHNRMVEHVKDVLATDSGLLAAYMEEGFWDYGERLFQAARFVTEMQYQHLVFEEFARTISPEIDVQPLNETAYHDSLDASIAAEFAHVTYRFGHSMLRETVDRMGFGLNEKLPLLDAFLAPHMFRDDGQGGLLTPNQGAAAVIQGMTRQVGNGIDEFVTETLRNELLGLPLDLATINLARARETGSPTLQAARAAFYADTLDGNLKPYESWEEFRLSLKHRASIVNFVAAYGDHPTLDRSHDGSGDPAMTIQELRDAAYALVTDDPGSSAFMNDPGAPGLEDVDFWIGGLAEQLSAFGGFLGSTFNHVFERQLEKLQNGDRFYYLNRNQGLNLFHQLENNSFAELIMRNTDATLLHANVFAAPTEVFDLSSYYDADCNVVGELPDGLSIVAGAIRYDGAEHVVIHGSDCDDRLVSGLGDDSVWGHDGNDRIEGGQGNDTLHGGAGDDIIQDVFGDDTIHGGDGNDAINAGPGADLFFGGPGKDFLLHGTGPTTSFAGAGDDFIRGGPDFDILTGNEGDDWLEGNDGHDLLQGDNALTFQNDPYGGHDVLIGGRGNDDHDAEGGDDIMLNNGIDRHAGMLGFDWVSHQDDPNPVNSDLDVFLYQPHSVTLMNSRFFSIEGLSGWHGDDVLRGASNRKDQPFADGSGNEMTEEHLDRIDGLRDLLGDHADRFTQTNESNNILLGGEGDDLIEGRAGDDYIDGKSWLQVALEWRPEGGPVERQFSMQAFQVRVFNGTINPGDLHIVREIVPPTSVGLEACDTAEYSGDLSEYLIEDNGDGTWSVTHVDAPDDDDRGDGVGGDHADLLRWIDRLKFADGERHLTENCGGVPLPDLPEIALTLAGDTKLASAATYGRYAARTVNTGAAIGEPTSVVREVRDAGGALVDAAVVEWEFADDVWVTAELTAIPTGFFGSNYDETSAWRITYPGPGSYTFTISLVGDDSGETYATASITTRVEGAGTPPGNGTPPPTGGSPPNDGTEVGGIEFVNPFTDIDGHTFFDDILTLVEAGVTQGCTPTRFCPNADISRGQMATFLVTLLDLAAPTDDDDWPQFVDVDDSSTHAESIAALVVAGLASGYAEGGFGPNDPVTRQQMATFLALALDLPEPPADYVGPFEDLNDGSVHNANILKIFIAGITQGTTDTTYDPNGFVTRGQMAAFLVRAFRLGEDIGA